MFDATMTLMLQWKTIVSKVGRAYLIKKILPWTDVNTCEYDASIFRDICSFLNAIYCWLGLEIFALIIVWSHGYLNATSALLIKEYTLMEFLLLFQPSQSWILVFFMLSIFAQLALAKTMCSLACSSPFFQGKIQNSKRPHKRDYHGLLWTTVLFALRVAIDTVNWG